MRGGAVGVSWRLAAVNAQGSAVHQQPPIANRAWPLCLSARGNGGAFFSSGSCCCLTLPERAGARCCTLAAAAAVRALQKRMGAWGVLLRPGWCCCCRALQKRAGTALLFTPGHAVAGGVRMFIRGPASCISTPAACLTNSIPLGSIPGSRAPLSSVLEGISKPATPHKKLRALS
jgi:hypothetical protein